MDNQKSKATKGKGLVIELSPLGDKKRNRTARDKGKHPEKYVSVEAQGRDNSKEGLVEIVTNTKNTDENYTGLQGLCNFVRDILRA